MVNTNEMNSTVSREDVLRLLQMLRDEQQYPASEIAAIMGIPEEFLIRLVKLAKITLSKLEHPLPQTEYSSAEAARMIGVSKSTLYRLLDEYDLDVKRVQEGRISRRVFTQEDVDTLRKYLGQD